jgi:hypothetical protein
MHNRSQMLPYSQFPFTILTTTRTIRNNSGNPIGFILHNQLPTNTLLELATDIQQLQIPMKVQKMDSKGTQQTLKLGHYLERGGQGRILQSKFHLTKPGQQLQLKYSDLWDFISLIANTYDPTYFEMLHQIPKSFRTLGIFSLFICNLIPPVDIHRDCKDYRWCFLFLFGSFVESGIYLYHLNLYVKLRPGDLFILNSNEIWHKADTYIQSNHTRFSGVLTTHNGLLQRFVNNKKMK